MSEIDLLPIYEAIKYRLKGVDPSTATHRGLQVYEYVPGSNEWPGALVLPPEVEDEGLANDWVTLRFQILILVAATIDESQLKLLEYQPTTGPRSIARAFSEEPTLGHLVGDIRITGSRPLNYEEQAGYQGYGAMFDVVARVG